MIDTIRAVTGEVVKGLQASPILLAIMILNLIMMGGIIYVMTEVSAANTARFTTVLERCLPK